MTTSKKSLIGSVVESVLSLFGGRSSAAQSDVDERALVEELTVSGFDPDGEPVIRMWSDGSLSIHFEAMPPFFAEDNGTESAFETFELNVQDALGVPVVRSDREVFVIENAAPDMAGRAKSWLEGFATGLTHNRT